MASAKREGKPDFDVGYMYQNTDRKYRDYYMLTFDVRSPREKRVDAEIAEAQEKLIASRQTLNAHLQQQLAQVQQLYVQASSNEEQLKEYREGSGPSVRCCLSSRPQRLRLEQGPVHACAFVLHRCAQT